MLERNFFGLFLWSKEEIVTQHAVVKILFLNSETAEPEKLRGGRISYEKAFLSRPVCCWLWGIKRVITTEDLNLQSSSFLSVLSLSLFSKNLSGQEEVGNVSLLLIDASS